MKAQPLPEIVAAGSPRDLGRQHGEQAHELIHETYLARMSRASVGIGEAAVLTRAKAYLPFVQRHTPELLDELDGLAAGSGMTLEQILFLQVATELELVAEDGCSVIGASGDGQDPFVAQNWDQPHDSLGLQVILRLRPDRGPEILMFARAGVIGYIGMNSYGVGLVNNQLYTLVRTFGLTSYFIMRKLLSFESVSAGLAWLREVPLGSAASYLLGDSSGDLVNIELQGGSFQPITGRVHTHTNHYKSAPGQAHDDGPRQLPDSLARLARLDSIFIGSGSGQTTAVLRDHDGQPTGICRHDARPGGLTTAASIILRLARGEMLVAYGPPCTTDYRTYRLDSPGRSQQQSTGCPA
jgi:isopenicillin-N N-acyltransferase-like protein